MPRKQTDVAAVVAERRRRVSSKSAPPDPPVDQTGPEVDDLPTPFDDYPGLFADHDGVPVVVALSRTAPNIYRTPDGDEIPIKGFCENLPPGESSYEAYVASKYGGGSYWVQARCAGRIVNQKTLHVSGAPIIQARSVPVSPQVDPVTGEYKDVDLGGSDKAFETRMLRLNVISKMLAPAPDSPLDRDLVMKILESVLQQKTQPVSEMLANVSGIVSSVREMLPDTGGTGAGMVDLIRDGLKALPTLLEKMSPAGPSPVVPGKNIGMLAAPVPATASNPDTETESDPMPQYDTRAIAGMAIQTIVESFVLGDRAADRCSVADTVETLAVQLGDLAPTVLSGIRAMQKPLRNLARTQLHSTYPEAEQEPFVVFFDSVFDRFTQPNVDAGGD